MEPGRAATVPKEMEFHGRVYILYGTYSSELRAIRAAADCLNNKKGFVERTQFGVHLHAVYHRARRANRGISKKAKGMNE